MAFKGLAGQELQHSTVWEGDAYGASGHETIRTKIYIRIIKKNHSTSWPICHVMAKGPTSQKLLDIWRCLQ